MVPAAMLGGNLRWTRILSWGNLVLSLDGLLRALPLPTPPTFNMESPPCCVYVFKMCILEGVYLRSISIPVLETYQLILFEILFKRYEVILGVIMHDNG